MSFFIDNADEFDKLSVRIVHDTNVANIDPAVYTNYEAEVLGRRIGRQWVEKWMTEIYGEQYRVPVTEVKDEDNLYKVLNHNSHESEDGNN